MNAFHAADAARWRFYIGSLLLQGTEREPDWTWKLVAATSKAEADAVIDEAMKGA